jgi:hypothetical protein
MGFEGDKEEGFGNRDLTDLWERGRIMSYFGMLRN